MSKSYTIVEKSQNNSLGLGAGWWFVLQGKFSDMAPLSFVGQSGSVALAEGDVPVTVDDAQVKNGVMSVKLDGVDGHKVPRQCVLTVGS